MTTDKKSVPDATEFYEPKVPPFKPLYWHILVQVPQPPEISKGGIVMPVEYRDSMEYASYIGVVASIGQFAFSAKTKADIDLQTMNRTPKVGDWVIFGKHAGEKFRTRDGTLWIIMADTELRGIADDPTLFECMKL